MVFKNKSRFVQQLSAIEKIIELEFVFERVRNQDFIIFFHACLSIRIITSCSSSFIDFNLVIWWHRDQENWFWWSHWEGGEGFRPQHPQQLVPEVFIKLNSFSQIPCCLPPRLFNLFLTQHCTRLIGWLINMDFEKLNLYLMNVSVNCTGCPTKGFRCLFFFINSLFINGFETLYNLYQTKLNLYQPLNIMHIFCQIMGYNRF